MELGNLNCVWTRGISNFDQFDFDHMKTIINRQPALAKLFVTKYEYKNDNEIVTQNVKKYNNA